MKSDKEIEDLFDIWNKALKTENPDEVVKLYAPWAILLPTVSNNVRTSHAEIRDYFYHFLQNKPQGKINESHIRRFGDLAIHSGVYTFQFNATPFSTVQARFTFVYQWNGQNWLIVEHHSSKMPENA